MKLSLSRINFLNILFTALIFSLTIGFFSITIINSAYEEKIEQLEKNYIEKNKLLVQDEINRAVKRIYLLKQLTSNSLNENSNKKLPSIILKELEKERFGEEEYGYFWVHDLEYNMLMHPIRKELLTVNLKTFKSKDGQYLFDNMNKLVLKKGAGYISYKWYKPNSNIIDEKISYVHLIKDMGIVIGSGFYLTELKAMIKDEKQRLQSSLTNNLKEIFFFISILLLLSLFAAWIISKKIKRIEIEQKEHLNMLEQYKLILDKSAVVSKTDKNGLITYVNNNFTKISGYTKDEAIGKPHNLVRHPQTPKTQFKKLWKNIQKGKIWKGILKNKRKDGSSYLNNTTIVPIKDSRGNILEYISSGSDVTELFENRTKLQSIFKTDTLTGLGNRIGLLDIISEYPKGVLVLINIDRFKEVNDIHGHKTGDMIIKSLAERLFKYVEEEEEYNLFRVQADIFALFDKKGDIKKVSSKIEHFMDNEGQKPYKSGENNFILSYSCGIATDTENLFTYADMALSEAKNKKIRLKVYEPSMNNITEYKQNILWVEKLHKALSEDRIVPYYQPIYNYHTKKVEKYECLMRLIEDDRVVPPGKYLSVAKKTKLYPQLTYKMAGKAICKFAKSDKEFSINLSIEDLMNEKLMSFIFDYSEQKGVFNRMVLEIVESEEMEDSDQISNTIKKFKNQGAKVAIDDFGSGYSNYEYLISLQADYIKIDGSITKHILEDERTAEVVRSIVNFAKKSKMRTIAEFVSSEELDKKLKELGVDYAQGWYYGKAEKELL